MLIVIKHSFKSLDKKYHLYKVVIKAILICALELFSTLFCNFILFGLNTSTQSKATNLCLKGSPVLP